MIRRRYIIIYQTIIIPMYYVNLDRYKYSIYHSNELVIPVLIHSYIFLYKEKTIITQTVLHISAISPCNKNDLFTVSILSQFQFISIYAI